MRLSKSYPFRAFCLLVLALLCQPLLAENTQKPLIFGFLPILSTQKLISRFKPLTDFISEQLQQPVMIETAPDYKEFVKRTRQQRYDILFTAPHFYYLANQENGYQVIVKVGGPDMRAIVVAKKSSHITNTKQLKGRTISTPDPLALGTILIRNFIRHAGLDPDKDVTLINTPTHNASLIAAYNGTTDAAGLMVPPYKRATPKIHDAMLILGYTRATPHMPISVAPTMAKDKVTKITTSLLGLSSTPHGQALLRHLSWPKGFTKATNEEYSVLKDMAVDLRSQLQ
jgi:phosphonate transport system substrate-binding protein